MSATLGEISNFEIKHPFPFLKQFKTRFKNLKGKAQLLLTTKNK